MDTKQILVSQGEILIGRLSNKRESWEVHQELTTMDYGHEDGNKSSKLGIDLGLE
jgi:hypothetical protein